jgi:hypothetical protein
MSKLPRKHKARLSIEFLEDRCNPSPVLIANVPLPGRDAAWNYSLSPFNASAVAADLDGNGQQEVLASGGDGNLYAFKYNPSSGGMDLYRTFATGQGGQIQSTPVLTDIGGQHIVYAANAAGFVFAWDSRSGALLPGWPVSVGGAAGMNGVFGSLAVGDLTGSGIPIVVATSFNHEVTAIRPDGSVLWQFNNDDTIFSGVAIGDLNGDGRLEVVVGGDSSPSQFYWQGGRINVLSADGRREWVKRTDEVIWSTPVMADLQGSGKLDVVVGTGLFYPTSNAAPFTGNTVYALDPNGNDLPGWPYSTGAASVDARVQSTPAVGDLLGNGQIDVVVADSQGKVTAIAPDGHAIWVTNAFTKQPLYSSPIIADITGSGRPDVVLSAGDGDGNGIVLRGLDGASGSPVFDYPNNGQPARPHYTAPAVGHFKGDGSYQMAVVANDLSSSGQLLSPSFMEVFDLGSSSLNPPWPQTRQGTNNDAVLRSQGFSVDLVNKLFNNALGRPIGSGELNNIWLPAFLHLPNLRVPIVAIVASDEAHRKEVTAAYETFLNRPPEQGGLNNFVAFLASGQSQADLQAIIGGSQEAFNDAGGTNESWVLSLYQHVLGRNAGNGEEAFWVNALNAGALSRAQVVLGFNGSGEYINKLVSGWYQTYGLGSPSVDQLAAITLDLHRGKVEEQVLTDVITSQGDYVSTQQEGTFLRAAYQDVLQRGISPGEVAFWENQIAAGVPLGAIAGAITHSNERNTIIVNGYFQTFLGRQPAPGEAAPFVNFLNSGGPRNNLMLIFLQSQEYFNDAGGTPAGYLNKVYTDLLGRLPGTSEQAFWLSQPNIRTALPIGVLFQVPTEYYQRLLTGEYFTLLRRFPSTPPDQSRLISPSAPFGAQGFVNGLIAGANQADIETSIIASPEYLGIALNKDFWNGARWLS